MLSGPLKSSRKYEPLTRGHGLNPNHDESSREVKVLGSGRSMVTSLKHEAIDGRAPPGVEPAAQFDSIREISPGQDAARIDRLIALSLRFQWWCMAVLC